MRDDDGRGWPDEVPWTIHAPSQMAGWWAGMIRRRLAAASPAAARVIAHGKAEDARAWDLQATAAAQVAEYRADHNIT